MDAFKALLQVAQHADKLPAAVNLAKAFRDYQKGDLEATEYLVRQGWVDAANLYRDGAGDMIRHAGQAAYRAYKDWKGDDPNVIEGEYRELPERYPWTGFVNRLLAQRYGGHVILGPPGSGKTTLALRLAELIGREHGYTVECFQFFPDDVSDFANPLSIDTLVKRMKQLQKYVNSQMVEDDDEDEESFFDPPDEDEKPAKPPKLPPQRRVCVVDEASLSMSSNANNPTRKAIIQALANCRHIDWVVIYIAQHASMLPLQSLGQTVVWVKQPGGRELDTDRDNPVVRSLWRRAGAAFAELSKSPYYSGEYANKKKWTYVDVQSLNGGRGWEGMVPVNKPGSDDEDDEDE